MDAFYLYERKVKKPIRAGMWREILPVLVKNIDNMKFITNYTFKKPASFMLKFL